jgi:hypothetical protein
MSGFAQAEGAIVNTLLSYLPTAAQDVVGVFDSNFNQLFADARPVSAKVKETAKLADHPVESGSIITDNRVILPIEIDLAMVLTPATYVDTYNEIKNTFNSNDTVYVQTNTGLYMNFLIKEMPHDESADHFDTITMVVKLREVQFVAPSISTLPPLADSAKNNGNLNGKSATATQTEQATEKTQNSSAAYSLLFGKGASAKGEE